MDDEPAIRRLLADLFVSEGYVVSEAPDGARALDGLKFRVPDVVILDLMMPVMSGWTFAEQCSRINGCHDLPIIALSATFDIQFAATQLDRLGVRAYLAKPFQLDVLLALVSKVA